VAIKSAINPGKMVAQRPGTISGAVNFLGGGSPLGTSVVTSAANKIVGFQRGAGAAVAPRVPDLGSIIQTLSSNILSNVENKFASANQTIQQVIQNNFAGQLGQFRNQVQEAVSNPPSKILSNFLGLYKNAIEYIRFLGDRKNVKRLGDNIKALQGVFTESFEVAILIRQTIKKIVKQLSNLPRARSGPGGLNLDVRVPGGPLKRSLPTKRNLAKMAMIGTGLVGAGAVGSQVINAISTPRETAQEVVSDSSMIPQEVLFRFTEILNRFDRALQSFRSPSSNQGSMPVPSPSMSPDDEKEKTSPGSSSSGASTAAPDLKTAIRQLESGNNYGATFKGYLSGFSRKDEDITKMTIAEVVQYQKDYIAHQKALGIPEDKRSAAVGAYQMLYPDTAAQKLGISLDSKFDKETQDKLSQYYLNVAGYQDWKAGKITDAEFNDRLAGQFASVKKVSGVGAYDNDGLNKAYGNIMPVLQKEKSGVTTPVTSATTYTTIEEAIRSSSSPQEVIDNIITQVSKPVASGGSQPQVNIVPITLGTPQSNSGTGMNVGSSPSSSGGSQVPFLSSSNEDNFFTMLSKVVYNIVDG